MNFRDEFEDISSSTPGSKPLRFTADNDEPTANKNGSDVFSEDIIYSNSNDTPMTDNVPLNEAFLIVGEEEMPIRRESRYQKSARGPLSFKNQKKLKNRIAIFNILVSIVLVISLFSTFVMGVLAYYTGGGTYQNITKNESELGINEQAQKLPKEVINIALFGLDSRSKNVENRKDPLTGRADTIIILSIDQEKNTVKMVSVLRDSWVEVENKGNSKMRKINAAYSVGGAECAIKTINSNFNLNITDYVAVSLHQLWRVIDLVCEAEGSGIKIKITEAERKQLNQLADLEGFGVKHDANAGEVELDGGQAMTYSRIRKIDNDSIRSKRQQKVLNCLFEKAKNIPISKYPGLLKEVLKNIETSLSYDKIFKFAPLLAGGSLSLKSETIPNKEVVAEGKIFSDTRGAWVWKYDLNEATRYIYKFLYNID